MPSKRKAEAHTWMTGDAFAACLAKLEIHPVDFAEVIAFNERTVRKWIDGTLDVPRWAAQLVNLMIKTNTKPENLKP
jgi:DNA-binding transcriptional regulator YiaG